MSKFNWRMRVCGIFLLWAMTAVALPAQTFTTLHRFHNTDGADPLATVAQAADGYLYGTTYHGGASGGVCAGGYSCGTVFKITTIGKLTSLYSFCPQNNCTKDGANPSAGLLRASDGSLYGTTQYSGPNCCGTVFKITPTGRLVTVYSFCSQTNCADGAIPFAGLVQGAHGNFYGTTYYGGANYEGTVFKITPSGDLTTLHSFDGADGANPSAGLIQAANGDFYGTTPGGGVSDNCHGGCGTVFKITPSGILTTLYNFCSQSNCADGANPEAGLVQATNGNFYGTTPLGGANPPYGTVFEITPSGTLTTLYNFCSRGGFNCTDGAYPNGLVRGTDGNFYGTTAEGGANTNACNGLGCGTVFKTMPSGALTTLHSFDGTDGAQPLAGLAQDTNGAFYGTTSNGGSNRDYGTVFRLSVGLGPFVETNPTSGKVGANVKILGTDLTGATSVTFNGTAATFTVKSKSLITTTVPSGATTGTVQVVTSGGTLSSDVPFAVN
jgi:uncharacterized repeat protein (TIGR03803 family)